MRLEKSLCLEIVHQVVSVIRGLMTFHALRLAEEQLLAAHFRRIRLPGIEFAIHPEFRSRGEVQQFLKLRHGVYLAPPVENVHALLLRNHWVPIEISGALFKLGEVLDALQRSLGT